jgi:hypothetical protein
MGGKCTKSAKIALLGESEHEKELKLMQQVGETLGMTATHVEIMHGLFRRADAFDHCSLTIHELVLGYKLETEWLGKLLFQSVSLCKVKKDDNTVTAVALLLGIWNLCTASKPLLAEMMFTFFHVAGKPKENMSKMQKMVYIGPNKLCRMEVERLVEIEFGAHTMDFKHLKELLNSLPHDKFGDIKKVDFLAAAISHHGLVLKPLIAFQRKLQEHILDTATWQMLIKFRLSHFPNDQKMWEIFPDLFEKLPEDNMPAGTGEDEEEEKPRPETHAQEGQPQQIDHKHGGVPIPAPLVIPPINLHGGGNQDANTHNGINSGTHADHKGTNTNDAATTPSTAHHIANVGDFFKDHYVPLPAKHGQHHPEMEEEHVHAHHHHHHHKNRHGKDKDNSTTNSEAELEPPASPETDEAKHHHHHHRHHHHKNHHSPVNESSSPTVPPT